MTTLRQQKNMVFIFLLSSFFQTKTTMQAKASSLIEKKLSESGYILPAVTPPIASYIPFVRTGNLIFMAGTLPMENGKVKIVGHVGSEASIEEAQSAAQVCVLNMLANLKVAVGNLDKVKKCVKITVLVNSTPTFTQHPEVANAASDFLKKIFGEEKGTHARAAFGTASLPRNATVEVEGIFEVEE